MNEELKPCPFCGGKDILFYHTHNMTRVKCNVCNGCGGDFYRRLRIKEAKLEAIEAWNKRV